jgi:tRNA-Thr(GGU) m(6)t(6)A37 methyltransferase TsaA
MFEFIGIVKSTRANKEDTNWNDVISEIHINEELQDGLIGLENFSHIIVVYHLNKAEFVKDKHLTRQPQERDDMPTVGIFAQRSKNRPNAIGLASVKLLSIEQNIVMVQGFDAINETPVLDIKPYYPVYDLMENVVVPEWVNKLMMYNFNRIK